MPESSMHEHMSDYLNRHELFGFWKIKPKYAVKVNAENASVPRNMPRALITFSIIMFLTTGGNPKNPLPYPFIYRFLYFL